ncbi:MAG TPA: hypothetical protein VNA66_10635, partial [Gammaproteobacteria bacterium]|nr:hypothetical protein [Gammaproteobacteria bacterium]
AMLTGSGTGSGAVVTTTTRTSLQLRIAAIAAAAAIQAADAQGPGDAVNVDVSECVNLTTSEERLACFEKQVEGARTNPTAASAPAAPSTAPPSSSGGKAEPLDIQARVAELRETVPNSYLITLDNGQVWRQTVPKAYALRPGDPVRVYYSRWRTYRLTNEKLRSFIQVERVR